LLKKYENLEYFTVPIHSSRVLKRLIIFIYGMAFGCIVYTLIYSLWGGSLFPLLIWHGVRFSEQPEIVACTQISSCHWRLVDSSGKTMIGKREEKAFRSPLCIILRFKIIPGGNKKSVILFFDSLSSDNYTHLLTRLWE